MPLPKIATPTYELVLPSSNKKVKYRPFLVKEEKLLLLAMESGEEKEIVSAVKTLLKNCITSRLKVDSLPSFDLEYIFLRIRAASVGEVIELTVTCTDDNETTTTASIDISEIEVEKSEDHSNKIMLDENTGIVMKYPSMDRFIDELKNSRRDFDTQMDTFQQWAFSPIGKFDIKAMLDTLMGSDSKAEKMYTLYNQEVSKRGKTVFALYSAFTNYATYADERNGFRMRNTGNDTQAQTMWLRE